MSPTANLDWDEYTEPSQRSGVRRSRARVLLVDDDEEMRTLVADLLLSEGFGVWEAASGSDLVRVIQSCTIERWPIDVIVVDHRMPGLTGLEALRRLRAQQRSTPAVLMTAFPEDEVERQAAALGAVMLPKPFSIARLMRAILQSLPPDVPRCPS